MTLKYIRDHYGVPAFRGHMVMTRPGWRLGNDWVKARIVSGTHYVVTEPIGFRGLRHRFHPTDTDHIKYIDQEPTQ